MGSKLLGVAGLMSVPRLLLPGSPEVGSWAGQMRAATADLMPPAGEPLLPDQDFKWLLDPMGDLAISPPQPAEPAEESTDRRDSAGRAAGLRRPSEEPGRANVSAATAYGLTSSLPAGRGTAEPAHRFGGWPNARSSPAGAREHTPSGTRAGLRSVPDLPAGSASQATRRESPTGLRRAEPAASTYLTDLVRRLENRVDRRLRGWAASGTPAANPGREEIAERDGSGPLSRPNGSRRSASSNSPDRSARPATRRPPGVHDQTFRPSAVTEPGERNRPRPLAGNHERSESRRNSPLGETGPSLPAQPERVRTDPAAAKLALETPTPSVTAVPKKLTRHLDQPVAPKSGRGDDVAPPAAPNGWQQQLRQLTSEPGPPAGTDPIAFTGQFTTAVKALEKAVSDLGRVDARAAVPGAADPETDPPGIHWLDEDELAFRLQKILKRQAQRRGIDLS
jgi:hypothetical protein